MAGAYTHYTAANAVLSQKPDWAERVLPYLPLYYFGAQGADFCFFYPVFKDYKKLINFGSYLHKEGGYDAFCVCKAFATEKPLFAYVMGYITHYAVDITFHPYIYAKSGKSPLIHHAAENALDSHFLHHFALNAPTAKFGQTPEKRHIQSLFSLYFAIAANAGFPPLSKSAFFRAVKVFNAYLPLPKGLFGQTYGAVARALANVENEPWKHPQTGKEYRLGASELMQNSIERSLALCQSFICCQKHKEPLSKAAFGKNYTSGL